MTTPDDPGPQRDPQDGARDGARREAEPAGRDAEASGDAPASVSETGPDGPVPRAAADASAGQDAGSGLEVPAGPDASDAPSASQVPDAPTASDVPAAPAAPAASDAGPDRVYRSGAGIAGGVLLLALVAWLGIDALVRGQGRSPWIALAAMLLLVPLVLAFTLRPAVYANNERLRVRNPFRTITLPWASVAALRSGYSNEVVAEAGRKYQLWAIPVSLRARKKAGREQLRVASGAGPRRSGGGMFGGGRGREIPGSFGGAGGTGGAGGVGRPGSADPTRAPADRTMDDLRELAEVHAEAPGAQGESEVKWAWEVMAPALAGLVLLAVLLGTG